MRESGTLPSGGTRLDARPGRWAKWVVGLAILGALANAATFAYAVAEGDTGRAAYSAVLAAVLAALAIGEARRRIVMDASGVRHRYAWGTRHLSWDALRLVRRSGPAGLMGPRLRARKGRDVPLDGSWDVEGAETLMEGAEAWADRMDVEITGQPVRRLALRRLAMVTTAILLGVLATALVDAMR